MLAIIVILILCLIESGTKGWYSLILAPAILLAIPITIGLQIYARRVIRGTNSRLLERLRWAQLLSLLIFLIAVPGIGDTDQVLLFGFLTSTTSSVLYGISGIVASIFLFVVPIAAVALLTCTIILSRCAASITTK